MNKKNNTAVTGEDIGSDNGPIEQKIRENIAKYDWSTQLKMVLSDECELVSVWQ